MRNPNVDDFAITCLWKDASHKKEPLSTGL